MKMLMTFATTALLALSLTACGGGSQAPDVSSSAHAADEAHEHGADTHTHEMAADTAGTYSDSTGAFFSGQDSTVDGHVHGADSHVH